MYSVSVILVSVLRVVYNSLPMTLSLTSEISSFDPLERVGDALISPGRFLLGLGGIYQLERNSDGSLMLKQEEVHFSLLVKIGKVAAIATLLLPILALFAAGIGYALKSYAVMRDPTLEEKYRLPVLVNARTEENFAGLLPPNPLSPNCVNSQQKSFWGELYNADPIRVPIEIEDPMAAMKGLLQNTNRPGFNSANLRIVEERSNYLHCEYTVVIPSGPLQGVYIDDLDLFYNPEERYFDIRSASRTGFRDAVHLDFSEAGANKKRIEAIRAAFRD